MRLIGTPKWIIDPLAVAASSAAQDVAGSVYSGKLSQMKDWGEVGTFALQTAGSAGQRAALAAPADDFVLASRAFRGAERFVAAKGAKFGGELASKALGGTFKAAVGYGANTALDIGMFTGNYLAGNESSMYSGIEGRQFKSWAEGAQYTLISNFYGNLHSTRNAMNNSRQRAEAQSWLHEGAPQIAKGGKLSPENRATFDEAMTWTRPRELDQGKNPGTDSLLQLVAQVRGYDYNDFNAYIQNKRVNGSTADKNLTLKRLTDQYDVDRGAEGRAQYLKNPGANTTPFSAIADKPFVYFNFKASEIKPGNSRHAPVIDQVAKDYFGNSPQKDEARKALETAVAYHYKKARKDSQRNHTPLETEIAKAPTLADLAVKIQRVLDDKTPQLFTPAPGAITMQNVDVRLGPVNLGQWQVPSIDRKRFMQSEVGAVNILADLVRANFGAKKTVADVEREYRERAAALR